MFLLLRLRRLLEVLSSDFVYVADVGAPFVMFHFRGSHFRGPKFRKIVSPDRVNTDENLTIIEWPQGGQAVFLKLALERIGSRGHFLM